VKPRADDGSEAGHSENGPDDRPPEPQVGISSLPGSGRLGESEAHQDRIEDSEDNSDDELHGSLVGWLEDTVGPGSDTPQSTFSDPCDKGNQAPGTALENPAQAGLPPLVKCSQSPLELPPGSLRQGRRGERLPQVRTIPAGEDSVIQDQNHTPVLTGPD